MKQILSIIISLVLIPLLMTVLFSIVNWILAQLFMVDYIVIQESPIWILYLIILAIIIITWFQYDPIVKDWND